MDSLPTILLILAAISMGATVIAALVALRSMREARSAIFPIVREEETIRARRARVAIFVWLTITVLFLGGWLATLRLFSADNSDLVSETAPTQTGEAIPAPLTVTPTATIKPSATPLTIVAGEEEETEAAPTSLTASDTPPFNPLPLPHYRQPLHLPLPLCRLPLSQPKRLPRPPPHPPPPHWPMRPGSLPLFPEPRPQPKRKWDRFNLPRILPTTWKPLILVVFFRTGLRRFTRFFRTVGWKRD